MAILLVCCNMQDAQALDRYQTDRFFVLDNENMKPEDDEFYLKSFFTFKGRKFIKVSRSMQVRASDIYNSDSVYGENDYLTHTLKIIKINLKRRRVLLLDTKQGEWYILRMSNGRGRAFLVPIDPPAKFISKLIQSKAHIQGLPNVEDEFISIDTIVAEEEAKLDRFIK